MATSVDIIIENQTDVQGPLTINLHLMKDQKPIKVILDGNTPSSPPSTPPSASYKPKFKYLGRAIVVTAIILALAITIGVIFATTNFMEKDAVETKVETKSITRIVSREEWLARSPVEPLDNLVHPVHRVIIAHTATPNCTNQSSCSYQVRIIQSFHMDSRRLHDIMYNFLIGGDGNVYEGRGWNAVGAHTSGFNAGSICIAFIGTFAKVEPSEKQLEAGRSLIDEGVRLNKIAKEYRLYGARQFVGTESPGRALYEIIKQWPNWSNNTSS